MRTLRTSIILVLSLVGLSAQAESLEISRTQLGDVLRTTVKFTMDNVYEVDTTEPLTTNNQCQQDARKKLKFISLNYAVTGKLVSFISPCIWTASIEGWKMTGRTGVAVYEEKQNL